ncbi:MAG TPA: hypothetical protein DDW17_06660 [Deltaproteobacteria bacterium]|nr:hypothetical protein [Deltaproteobacteria bacterium]
MIPLREIQPTGITSQPESGFPDLIENLLIRTFFEPWMKDQLGWIGASYRSGPRRSWTIKIKKRKGIYCITYLGFKKNAYHWISGTFNIQYFPDLNEKVLDTFSVQENIIRLHSQFEEWLRKIPDREDPLESPFTIGKMLCTVDTEEKALFLSLLAPIRWRTIQRDGLIISDKNGEPVEAVPPNGIDRNVPAFKLAWQLLDILILTFCYQLKCYPIYVLLKERTSRAVEVSRQGDCLSSHKHQVKERMLTVGFEQEGYKIRDSDARFFIRFFPVYDFHAPFKKYRLLWSYMPSNPSSLKGNRLWWEASLWTAKADRSRRNLSGIEYRPQLVIFTGFLGSGKTTLINRIVEHQSLQRNKFVVIIQNEVGKVDIDADLIDGAFNITTLNDGCVCCTIRGELRTAVRQVCIQYSPDIIILETTGVADPQNILEELPSLAPFIRFDSLITVVDGRNIKTILAEYPVARSQIINADLLILNKTDLMDAEEIETVKEILSKINPRSPVLPCSMGDIGPSVLFYFGNDTGIHKERECISHKEIEHGHCYPDFFEVVTINLQGVFVESDFIDFLNNLPNSIYRVKGVVKIKGYQKPQLLQYVGGYYELTHFLDTTIQPNSLVFIGKKFDKDIIEKELKRLILSKEP